MLKCKECKMPSIIQEDHYKEEVQVQHQGQQERSQLLLHKVVKKLSMEKLCNNPKILLSKQKILAKFQIQIF